MQAAPLSPPFHGAACFCFISQKQKSFPGGTDAETYSSRSNDEKAFILGRKIIRDVFYLQDLPDGSQGRRQLHPVQAPEECRPVHLWENERTDTAG